MLPEGSGVLFCQTSHRKTISYQLTHLLFLLFFDSNHHETIKAFLPHNDILGSQVLCMLEQNYCLFQIKALWTLWQQKVEGMQWNSYMLICNFPFGFICGSCTCTYSHTHARDFFFSLQSGVIHEQTHFCSFWCDIFEY